MYIIKTAILAKVSTTNEYSGLLAFASVVYGK